MRYCCFSALPALVTVAFMASGVHSTYAIRAYRDIIEFVQPDGTVVNISLSGDENDHWVTTEDGFLLIANHDGGYEYAIPGTDGKIISSGISARNADMRNAATTTLLSRIDKSSLIAKRMEKTTTGSLHESNKKGAKKFGLFPDANFPTTGSPKALIILVEYNDIRFSTPSPHAYFEGLVNTSGFAEYGATGSVSDWFRDNSDGKFTPLFDVLGPVTLSGNRSYYGGNNSHGNDQAPHKMAVEACDILNATVDFSKYDNDGDGIIDNVFIFFAGKGENRSGETDAVWPHTSWVTQLDFIKHEYDGVTLDRYACTNELYDERPDGIGTFCHEFSHVMGLPDLYNTSAGSQPYTPGAWSVMDYGPYLNDGRTPPLYSSFEKMALGWISPTELTDNQSFALTEISENKACSVTHVGGEELFLFENRQHEGWDRYLPGHGMLVWHVQYDEEVWNKRIVNNDAAYQYVDLVEADNVISELSRGGDAFPGTEGRTEFGTNTIPSFRFNDNTPAELSLSAITERPDGSVTFRVGDGSPAPADVEQLRITGMEPTGLTLEWDPVENITKYIVRYKNDSETDYHQVMSDATNHHTLTDLIPETNYQLSVSAFDGVEESLMPATTEATTASPGVDYFQSRLNGVSAISSTSFHIDWEETPKAESYILNVAEISKGEPYKTTIDFAEGIDNLPGQWATSSRLTFANNAYSGEAPLSLRLSADGDYITTGVLDDRATRNLILASWLRHILGRPYFCIRICRWRMDGGCRLSGRDHTRWGDSFRAIDPM